MSIRGHLDEMYPKKNNSSVICTGALRGGRKAYDKLQLQLGKQRGLTVEQLITILKKYPKDFKIKVSSETLEGYLYKEDVSKNKEDITISFE